MTMTYRLIYRLRNVFLVALFCQGWLCAQSLSFTFDDGFDPRVRPQAAAWNRDLLDGLAGQGVDSMLFPAGRVVGSDAGMALVRAWSAAGHAIGNHSVAHRNFNSSRTTLESFTQDLQQANAQFNALDGWRPMLRFPCLKEGDTHAKRDGLRTWMTEHGYRNAPVSIDTSDWYYAERYLDNLAHRRCAS